MTHHFNNGIRNFNESQGTTPKWLRSSGTYRDILGKGMVGFLVTECWLLPPLQADAVSQTWGLEWNKIDK